MIEFDFMMEDDLQIFELAPERRRELIESAGVGIDPITNRGASAAREIIAFITGHEIRTGHSADEPQSLAEYMREQTGFFVDHPQHMNRFGMSADVIEDVDYRLRQSL